MKTCTKCGVNKLANEFYSASKNKDKLKSSCRSCDLVYYKKRYSEKRDEINAKNKQRRLSRHTEYRTKEEAKSHTTEYFYGQYKCRAKRFKLDFQLTLEDFKELISEPCYYCGITSDLSSKSTRNGIDRVFSDIGYVFNNTVACCRDCNYAKKNRSIEEFRKWAVRLYIHFCD